MNKMLSVEDALAHLLADVPAVEGTEDLPLDAALDRVLAADVTALVDVPPLDNSAMDGYALRTADLAAGNTLPVTQRIPAGSVGQPLAPGSAARIFTGAPVPSGADAVVMQEHCIEVDGRVTVNRLPKPGENIRRRGEDMTVGQTVLPAGTPLGPAALGVAAAAGAARLTVHRRLKAAVFFTGDEIVMPGEPLAPGQIYNSNRFVLRALLAGMGCEVVDLGIVPDRFDATVAVLERAAREADVVLTSGGVSVGEEDHVKAAAEKLGSLSLWKVAMKPGKPLAFGQVNGTAFLGLPGNPVSAFVVFCLFARPYLLARMGVTAAPSPALPVTAGFAWPRAGDRREYARARLEATPEGLRAVIYPNQGSGVLTSLAWAQGLVEIPEGRTVQPGEMVRYHPFSTLVR